MDANKIDVSDRSFVFSGVEILNKAINKLTSKGSAWRTILIEISVSNIRITDCTVRRCLLISRKVCFSAFGYCEAKKTVDTRNIWECLSCLKTNDSSWRGKPQALHNGNYFCGLMLPLIGRRTKIHFQK